MENRRNKRKAVIVLGSVAIIGLVVTAGILTFYVNIESTVDVSSLMTFDDTPAEELTLSRNIDGVPGNTYEYEHTINLSGSATDTVNVSFDWLSDEGLTGSMYYDGYSVEWLVLSPGGSYNLTEHIELDPLLSSGSYSVNLTIS